MRLGSRPFGDLRQPTLSWRRLALSALAVHPVVYVRFGVAAQSFVLGCNVASGSCWVSTIVTRVDDRTLKLIDRLCVCFAEASVDEDHPAVRYGRQLEALKKKLSVMSVG